MKKKIFLIIIIILLLVLGTTGVMYSKKDNEKEENKENEITYSETININDLTYKGNKIKVYTQKDYNDFINDYNNEKLDDVYVTEFLFDGVGMYKTYDLDDFIEEGNSAEVKALSITAFNIHNAGNYEFSGNITGGMIAVNTNNLSGDINITLNNVSIDTDSKKVPAIYVYNKDINYTDYNVNIISKEGSSNYIEGGKLKKVSLIPSEELSNYSSYYSSTNKTYYNEYTNYYGVYNKEQINNILFAKITADSEDLADGDPYYFYKAAGAISSDIDLTFSGSGYLEVVSKNKEGIETKGNLTLNDGDYKITAMDDCLNTTTETGRNTLTINVNSLDAIVSLEADEGDAIDSNGSLIINGGKIVAVSKPGSDAGLDSNNGIIINGGEVIATGDMFDGISSSSTQNYVIFNIQRQEENTYTLKDSSGNEIMNFTSDRTFSNIVFSSSLIEEGTYSLYNGNTLLKSSQTNTGSSMMGPGKQRGTIPPNIR